MTTPTFTTGPDTYTVTDPGDYILDLLAGDDSLTVNGGTTTTATMDEGNDYVRLLSGMATVDGGAGNDRFDIVTSGVTVSGGADDDVFNLLAGAGGGSNQTINGNDGNDTVNFSTDITNLSAELGAGSDTFAGHHHIVSGMLSGGAGNDSFLDLDGSNLTLAGGAGDDTYLVSGTSFSATIQENAGEGTDTVQSYIGFTLGANVENLTLMGTAAVNATGNTLANVLTGNNAANSLLGGAGNDTLYGNGGSDTLDGGTGTDQMYGGTGNDVFIVRDATDQVYENASEGTDRVVSTVTYTLGANLENLSLSGSANIDGTGNDGKNVIVGNSGDNALYGLGGVDKLVGNAGNDTLDGGIGGHDRLIGGTGNDTYMVDSYTDVAVENAGQGTDQVYSTANYRLSDNVENLTLNGVANIYGIGNDLDNVLTGNSGGNKLFGLGGNDVLDGGAGNDRLFGGLGDDTYYVDSYNDRVLENAGEGTDSVFSSASYKLGANLEQLTLTGTADLYGYGNAGDNSLIGNSGDNKLFGLEGNDMLDGGAGADRMVGGTGNDTYYVDNLGDVVVENAGEGTDTIHSQVTLTLSDNVENGVVDGSAGIGLYGNELDNDLQGNVGNDTLDGGAGNDTIHGNAGEDFLYGGTGNDVLSGDTGNDSVFGQDGNDNISGGVGNDLLYGGAGTDVLDGGTGDDYLMGGSGQDTLTGGAGTDHFLFSEVTDSPLGAWDTITDFQSNAGSVAGDDVLDLTQIDANTAISGDQAFTWGGSSAGANSVWYSSLTQNGDGSAEMLVNGDVNGDGIADFQIMLHLTTGSFSSDDLGL